MEGSVCGPPESSKAGSFIDRPPWSIYCSRNQAAAAVVVSSASLPMYQIWLMRMYESGSKYPPHCTWGISIGTQIAVSHNAEHETWRTSGQLSGSGHSQAITMHRCPCRYMLLFQMDGVEAVIAANNFALWRLMLQDEKPDIVDRQVEEWSQNGTGALKAGTLACKMLYRS